MTTHTIPTRDERSAARKALLSEEKEHTRPGDEPAHERRALPWVRVEPRDATALVGTTPVPWTAARDRLADPEPARTHWLATARADGRPHLMPIIGIWRDDAFYFVAGAGTKKARNLAADGRCAIGTCTTTNPSLDVILEGVATAVTDPAEMRQLAETYASVLGWPLQVRDDGLHGPNAPTAGPPPYTLFRMTPTTAFGLPGVAGMSEVDPDERHTPTRWQFESTTEP